jgi:hypothetical protein
MVNNLTNINKMISYLSSQIIEHIYIKIFKKATTYTNGNVGPGLGQAQKNGRVKPANNEISALLLLYI